MSPKKIKEVIAEICEKERFFYDTERSLVENLLKKANDGDKKVTLEEIIALGKIQTRLKGL